MLLIWSGCDTLVAFGASRPEGVTPDTDINMVDDVVVVSISDRQLYCELVVYV